PGGPRSTRRHHTIFCFSRLNATERYATCRLLLVGASRPWRARSRIGRGGARGRGRILRQVGRARGGRHGRAGGRRILVVAAGREHEQHHDGDERGCSNPTPHGVDVAGGTSVLRPLEITRVGLAWI